MTMPTRVIVPIARDTEGKPRGFEKNLYPPVYFMNERDAQRYLAGKEWAKYFTLTPCIIMAESEWDRTLEEIAALENRVEILESGPDEFDK